MLVQSLSNFSTREQARKLLKKLNERSSSNKFIDSSDDSIGFLYSIKGFIHPHSVDSLIFASELLDEVEIQVRYNCKVFTKCFFEIRTAILVQFCKKHLKSEAER